MRSRGCAGSGRIKVTVLRRYGYRGAWRHSPWGRFGDFWKSHEDAASLLQETQRLEALKGKEFWGRRRAERTP
jgi:hypothetical protein